MIRFAFENVLSDESLEDSVDKRKLHGETRNAGKRQF